MREGTAALYASGMARGPVLAVSPHPDDELLGAGGTLLRLLDAGVRVVNLAVSLGRPPDRERRRAELERACEVAGFDPLLLDPPLAISRDDDLPVAERELTGRVERVLGELGPDVLVAPSPHDGHHGHELTGRAVRDAVEARGADQTVWWWGLWAELPLPNLAVDVESVADTLLSALQEHRSQLERNDFAALAEARARGNAVLGAERVFGTGAERLPFERAELLCETTYAGGEWRFAKPRVLEPAELRGDPAKPAGWLLHAESFAARAKHAR